MCNLGVILLSSGEKLEKTVIYTMHTNAAWFLLNQLDFYLISIWSIYVSLQTSYAFESLKKKKTKNLRLT